MKGSSQPGTLWSFFSLCFIDQHNDSEERGHLYHLNIVELKEVKAAVYNSEQVHSSIHFPFVYKVPQCNNNKRQRSHTSTWNLFSF